MMQGTEKTQAADVERRRQVVCGGQEWECIHRFQKFRRRNHSGEVVRDKSIDTDILHHNGRASKR